MSLGGLTKDFFGQCWTLTSECDGFWRNYCSLDAGVRIETTAIKLLRAVWDATNEHRSLQAFVGKVIYQTDVKMIAELREWKANGCVLLDQSNLGCAQAMLIKREEFLYEDEVRVVVDRENVASDDIPFSIEASKFIHRIMFAPKMNDDRCKAYANWLEDRGFAQSQITRSKLYDPWTLTMRM